MTPTAHEPVYVYVHFFWHIYTYIYIDICTYPNGHDSWPTTAHEPMYVCMYKYIYAYECMGCARVCVFVWSVCVKCVCVFVYVCVCIWLTINWQKTNPKTLVWIDSQKWGGTLLHNHQSNWEEHSEVQHIQLLQTMKIWNFVLRTYQCLDEEQWNLQHILL